MQQWHKVFMSELLTYYPTTQNEGNIFGYLLPTYLVFMFLYVQCSLSGLIDFGKWDVFWFFLITKKTLKNTCILRYTEKFILICKTRRQQ